MAMEIEALIILEIMGRPPEHLVDTLKKLIEKMESDKGVKITSKKISEIKEVENNLYSTFAEIELRLDGINQLISIIFTYMPSHVELIKPAEIKLNNFDFNALSSEIVRRLHYYDGIVKSTLLQNKALQNQIKYFGFKPTIKDEPEKKINKKVKKKNRI